VATTIAKATKSDHHRCGAALRPDRTRSSGVANLPLYLHAFVIVVIVVARTSSWQTQRI
jgi:hypothetical protein